MEYLDALNLLILLECKSSLTEEEAKQLEAANKAVRLFNMIDKKAA